MMIDSRWSIDTIDHIDQLAIPASMAVLVTREA